MARWRAEKGRCSNADLGPRQSHTVMLHAPAKRSLRDPRTGGSAEVLLSVGGTVGQAIAEK